MTFEDAVSALEGAVEAENAAPEEPSIFAPTAPAQQATESPAPQGENDPSGVAPEAPEAPVAPVAPEVPAVDTFDNGQFNPDELPEELQPAWHKLQAAFTRKTQDVAEQRKALESLGDINEVTQAAQLYKQLQDPQNWPRFQQEIAQLMEQNGIQPPAAVAPAAPAVTPAAPALDLSAQGLLSEYPELAPLAQTLEAMQQQLAETRAQMQQTQTQVAERENAMRAEAQQQAALGEFQRQESVLRAEGFTDGDMSRVYEIAHAHNGNLLAASAAYTAMKHEVLADYLAKKTEARQSGSAPIFGGGATSATPPAQPKTFEEATDIALERLRASGLEDSLYG